MSENIIKVIAHSNKRRDIIHANAIHLEQNIADFEGKLGLTEGELVILDHIATKLQMYDAKFHKHHYRLVDCIDNAAGLEVQQRIFENHDHRMIDFFRWMMNMWCLE